MKCAGCGGALEPERHFCSWCGRPVGEEAPRTASPHATARVLPREVDAGEARAALDEYLRSSFKVPRSVAECAGSSQPVPFLEPAWIASARAGSNWIANVVTSQRGRTPAGSVTLRVALPMTGRHEGRYENLLICTDPDSAEAITIPIPTTASPRVWQSEDEAAQRLGGLDEAHARDRMAAFVRTAEAIATRNFAPGSGLRVNTVIDDVTLLPIWRPLWRFTVQWKRSSLHFCVDGTTGAATGILPRSFLRSHVGGVALAVLMLAGGASLAFVIASIPPSPPTTPTPAPTATIARARTTLSPKKIAATKGTKGSPALPAYTIAEEWKPSGIETSRGADIIVTGRPTREEYVALVRALAGKNDPVVLHFFESDAAWKRSKETPPVDDPADFVAVFLRNASHPESGSYGTSEMRWMQRDGRFASMAGTKTALELPSR